jgi:hypothetical protein
VKAHHIDGHHLKQLLFWRHAEKPAAVAASETPAGQMAAAAPVAAPRP